MGTNSKKVADNLNPRIFEMARDENDLGDITDEQIAAAAALVGTAATSLLQMPEAQLAAMAGGTKGLNLFIVSTLARFFVPLWIKSGAIDGDKAVEAFEELAGESLADIRANVAESGIFDQ